MKLSSNSPAKVLSLANLLFQAALVKTGISNTIKLSSASLRFRRHTSDLTCFKQIFIDREYDFPMPAPATIIDLGANSGMFTIWIKNKYPDAHVIALEPEPDNFKALQSNTSGLHGVKTFNLAVWSSSANLNVCYQKGGEWAATVGQDSRLDHDSNVVASSVRGISISDLLEEEGLSHVDLLKIDIEGSELEIFNGDCSWLRRIGIIVIELHDYMRPGCSKAVMDALSCLSDYSLSWKGENLIIHNRS